MSLQASASIQREPRVSTFALNRKKLRVQALPDMAALMGAHWHYGRSHMVHISKARASLLCEGALPPIGYERTARRAPSLEDEAPFSGPAIELVVMNCAGAYYLACTNAKVDAWEALFDVQVLPPQHEHVHHAESGACTYLEPVFPSGYWCVKLCAPDGSVVQRMRCDTYSEALRTRKDFDQQARTL